MHFRSVSVSVFQHPTEEDVFPSLPETWLTGGGEGYMAFHVKSAFLHHKRSPVPG